MNRIDILILRRLGSRICLVLAVLFGLFALAQTLDAGQSQRFNETGGPLMVVAGIAVQAFDAILTVLPSGVLIGTIVAVLDLQSRREMVAIKATGLSIWRLLRAPLVFALLAGALVIFVIEPAMIQARSKLPLSVIPTGATSNLWLEQNGADGPYILTAETATVRGTELEGVTVFFTQVEKQERIEAETAVLVPGAWSLTNATRYAPNQRIERAATLEIPTGTTAGNLSVRFTQPRDLTLIQLLQAVSAPIADPAVRAAALTSLYRLLLLPALLCGSVLIGFAFTSGYQRTNRYGAAVLYGVVLGFVVYVVTELANRAGFAGVLDPTFATAGPAFVAIVIGLTVLLFREDGRT
jgi:lipopolysaccharide export system permease protein